MRIAVALAALLPAACVTPPVEEPEPQDKGLAVLGAGSHGMDAVKMTTLVDAEDGLAGPRDLDFNPEVAGDVWVVNRIDDGVVLIHDVGTADQETEHFVDPFALHFMEEVSSISFASGMKFGTCQESRNTYNDEAAANDFMGPALWSAEADVFAITNPDAVAELGYDLGSHLDMLHESPNCMGIAWIEDNKYFTFDGMTSSVSRYDFKEDHGPGFDDHSDGVIERFQATDDEDGVKRTADVPSHMVYDHGSGLLYIADTGHGRIAVLDPEGPTDAAESLPVIEGGTRLLLRGGATFETLVSADDGELEQPSGLALHDGVLYVTDNATSRISAFDLDGERIDYLDTDLPAGSLMGLRVDADGNILVTDFAGDRVLKIEAK